MIKGYQPTPERLGAAWDCLEREIDWPPLREIPDSSAMGLRLLRVLLRDALMLVMVAEPQRIADIMPDDPPGPASAAIKRLTAHFLEHMETRDPDVSHHAVAQAVRRADRRGARACDRELTDALIATLLADLPRRGTTW